MCKVSEHLGGWLFTVTTFSECARSCAAPETWLCISSSSLFIKIIICIYY